MSALTRLASMALDSGQHFAFVYLPSLPFACFMMHSLQPRFTQGGKMMLQHCWVFDRHSLFVNLH